MARIARTDRTRQMPRRTGVISRDEFKSRLAARMTKGDGPDEELDPDIFDDWDDAADMLAHFRTAPVERLTAAHLAGTRKHAKPSGRTRAFDKSRVVTTRKASSENTKRKSTGTRTGKKTLAQSVRPGVSLGPPRRLIGARFITPEVDVSQAKFRRQQRGVGKCTGGKLTDVRRAFTFSFMMLECAKLEVRAIKRNPTDARILWHASREDDRASLGYWFGENYDHTETMTMLHKIDEILSEWSMAFCGGFRDVLPVFIRCKSRNGAGDGPARHIVKNTIELFPRYFDMPRARQSVTMLHEMGHRCKSLLKPRDERHDLCSGGWNNRENMCYRDPDEITGFDSQFTGSNPRTLAQAATDGSESARTTLLNNIDNYVCYIWNRYVDHGESTLFLLSEGAKQAKPKPSGKPTSKPVN